MATSLTRITSSISNHPPIQLLFSAARNFSTRSEMLSSRFESESDPEPERSSLQKLEDAVHRVVVRRSQPDWLPFRPGSSYWVPPKTQARGFAHVMTNLANSVAFAADPDMDVVSSRGWPSDDYFLQGDDPSGEVVKNSKHTTKSEDDEG